MMIEEKTQKADNYPVAHGCLVALVVLMGVASTMGVLHLISGWGIPKPFNYALMAVVGAIAFLLSFLSALLAKAYGAATNNTKCTLLIFVCCIMACDGSMQTIAVMQAEKLSRTEVIKTAEAAVFSAERYLVQRPNDDFAKTSLRNAQRELREARTSRLNLGWAVTLITVLQLVLFFVRGQLHRTTIETQEEIDRLRLEFEKQASKERIELARIEEERLERERKNARRRELYAKRKQTLSLVSA